MSVDRSYIAKNDVERARLKAFVAKASDADLAHAMPAGWTVASVLAHLAFWDQRILALLETWEKTGVVPGGHAEDDVDWINDAGKPFLLALSPRTAAEMTVAIAEAVDRKVAALPDDLVAKNASGSPLNLSRAVHRKDHLDEIEKVLKR